MSNYFNTLPLREQLEQLGKCRFMDASEFEDGVNALKGKKIVIVGCGAQGLKSRVEYERFWIRYFLYTYVKLQLINNANRYKNATI